MGGTVYTDRGASASADLDGPIDPCSSTSSQGCLRCENVNSHSEELGCDMTEYDTNTTYFRSSETCNFNTQKDDHFMFINLLKRDSANGERKWIRQRVFCEYNNMKAYAVVSQNALCLNLNCLELNGNSCQTDSFVFEVDQHPSQLDNMLSGGDMKVCSRSETDIETKLTNFRSGNPELFRSAEKFRQGIQHNQITIAEMGKYNLVYTATDKFGNNQCVSPTRVVVVQDTKKPEISLKYSSRYEGGDEMHNYNLGEINVSNERNVVSHQNPYVSRMVNYDWLSESDAQSSNLSSWIVAASAALFGLALFALKWKPTASCKEEIPV